MGRLYADLKEITERVSEMGNLSLSMLKRATDSLISPDAGSAEDVIKDYDRISFLDSLIEEEALRILILYQPMASDMRFTATVLKIITHLERIGKYSKNIAKAVVFLRDKETKYRMDEIYVMCNVAVEMVNGVVKAFESRDIKDLENYSALDDKLDGNRCSVIENNVKHMANDADHADAYTYFISIAKYLERVGDNACKIAEKIIYMVSGKHVDLDGTAKTL